MAVVVISTLRGHRIIIIIGREVPRRELRRLIGGGRYGRRRQKRKRRRRQHGDSVQCCAKHIGAQHGRIEEHHRYILKLQEVVFEQDAAQARLHASDQLQERNGELIRRVLKG